MEEKKLWYISISNQQYGNKIVQVETDDILEVIWKILRDNDHDNTYDINYLPNLVEYYGQTRNGSNLIIIAQHYLTGYELKGSEEETMEKNYTTLRENFGSMPLPGYISELNQKICTKDGWDVIAFLKELDEATQQLTGASEHRDWEEQEAFIVLSYDDSSMELQWEILFDLANSEKKFYYDTHYYRIYTKDQDWGLDEIEPIKEEEEEEYELVKVKVYRDCVVRECAELYISVKKGFGEDAKEEAEHYVANSYCGNIEWERESEYDYEEEGDIQIDESWVEDTGIKEELESSYDIDETLEY